MKVHRIAVSIAVFIAAGCGGQKIKPVSNQTYNIDAEVVRDFKIAKARCVSGERENIINLVDAKSAINRVLNKAFSPRSASGIKWNCTERTTQRTGQQIDYTAAITYSNCRIKGYIDSRGYSNTIETCSDINFEVPISVYDKSDDSIQMKIKSPKNFSTTIRNQIPLYMPVESVEKRIISMLSSIQQPEVVCTDKYRGVIKSNLSTDIVYSRLIRNSNISGEARNTVSNYKFIVKGIKFDATVYPEVYGSLIILETPINYHIKERSNYDEVVAPINSVVNELSMLLQL